MKSNFEWQYWGKADPLFGVASWEGRERSGANPWTDEEFYRLSDDWDDFSAEWRRTVGYASGTVLEIGSGAGRITRKLAAEFSRVIATDVSIDIIAYAKKRVSDQNIDWRASNGDSIPADAASVEAVFSCHVLQHFPSPAAQLATFREMHRVLKDGGTFFVHLPIHKFPDTSQGFSRLLTKLYAGFLRLSGVRAGVRRLLMRFGYKPYMHGVSYEMKTLISDLQALGFDQIAISFVPVRNGNEFHSCVSGRKPLKN